jgi:hypothetical protein
MNDTHPIRMLARQYPQLCLPIMPNERETEEYRACVLMGEPVRRAPEFAFSEEDEFSFVSTPVGEVPVLVLADREDFVHAYRALACRCEPEVIPDSVGAVTVQGLINWEKIRRHRDAYLAEGGSDWDEEFRRFTSVNANYRDSFILLSTGSYSDIPAAAVGLGEQEWKAKSLTIRKYHELTHFVCRTKYPKDIDEIRDEVVADMIGLIQAFGTYDTGLAETFLGIEGTAFRPGGRLAHYAKEDIAGAMTRAKALIRSYAERIKGRDLRDVFALLLSLFEGSPG